MVSRNLSPSPTPKYEQGYRNAWYDSPSGHYAAERLQKIICGMTADIFGYYALEIGALAGQWNLLNESRIRQHFKLKPTEQLTSRPDIMALPDNLPVAFSSVDLVIACHALDFADSAHEVLREIERILVPEGHCILIGFNPFSFRGGQLAYQRLGQRIRRKQSTKPIVPDTYSSFRVREWFSVLGFEMMEVHHIGFRPALGGGRIFRRLGQLESIGNRYQLACGNVYIMHARKRVTNSRLLPAYPTKRRTPLLQPGIAVGVSRDHRQQHTQHHRYHTQDNQEQVQKSHNNDDSPLS